MIPHDRGDALGTPGLVLTRSESVGGLLVRRGSAVGAALGLDRAFSFLAGALAARTAGAETFGGYSIIAATANALAGYAGAGVSAAAMRFAGEYPSSSSGYSAFLRALAYVSLVAAALAALMLFAGSDILARALLRNEALTVPLRLAALLAGGAILLECCRGLLIGQHNVRGLLVLSVVWGVGLLAVLPAGARVGAGAMIGGQAAVALTAVLLCVLLAGRLGITPRVPNDPADVGGPSVRSLLTFGLAQLGGVVGLNIATWWLVSLVARADTSLVQMGCYAVASQFRGLVSIAPGLIAQVGYPLLTDEGSWRYGGAGRVVVVNSVLASGVVLAISGVCASVLPWVLAGVYGESYMGAEIPAILLLATAIIHMGGAPAANRMYIVNLRLAALINAAWTVLVVVIGTWWVPRAGAIGAAATLFASHIVSHVSVLLVLRRVGALSRGLLWVSAIAMAAAMSLVGWGCLRVASRTHSVEGTWGMAGTVVLFLLVLIGVGRREGLLRHEGGDEEGALTDAALTAAQSREGR